jgi:gamma-glutamylcyclotransferase (GGCT)/AIG2-like uncharacterized protein YtfP
MSQLPAFVYGTLRTGHSNHAIVEDLLAGARDALLPGHQLYARHLPYVSPADEADAIVTGELLLIRPDGYQEALRRLDRLEGYRPGDPGSLYTRERCRALALGDDGEWHAHDAWVYLAGARFDCSPRWAVPSGDWADVSAPRRGLAARA